MLTETSLKYWHYASEIVGWWTGGLVNTSEGREALSGKDKLLHHSQSLSTERGNPEEFPPVVVYMFFFLSFLVCRGQKAAHEAVRAVLLSSLPTWGFLGTVPRPVSEGNG